MSSKPETINFNQLENDIGITIQLKTDDVNVDAKEKLEIKLLTHIVPSFQPHKVYDDN